MTGPRTPQPPNPPRSNAGDDRPTGSQNRDNDNPSPRRDTDRRHSSDRHDDEHNDGTRRDDRRNSDRYDVQRDNRGRRYYDNRTDGRHGERYHNRHDDGRHDYEASDRSRGYQLQTNRSRSPVPRRRRSPSLPRRHQHARSHPQEVEEDNEGVLDEHLENAEEGDEETNGVVDRRFYKELFKVLARTKSAKWSIKHSGSPAGQLSKLARFILRRWGPFIDMSVVFTTGMAWYGGPPTRWANADEAALSSSLRERLQREKHYVKIFNWLQERVPFLQDIVPMMVGRSHDTFLLGAFLDTHARQARATDLNSLKKYIPDYVEPASFTPSTGATVNVAPPNGPNRHDKAWYGFHSLWTARLLVPRACRDDFDACPEGYCDSVNSGRIIIDHQDWPSYVYQDGVFDHDAVDVGLARGELLRKTVRHIFTSPSSVTKPAGQKGLGRGCLSQIYKLDSVAPESIAYIATLVRNLLSSADCWEIADGAFKGEQFYNSFVLLFNRDDKNADEDWVRETLVWWNESVYGDPHDPTAGEVMVGRRAATVPQTELLATQRAARKAARLHAQLPLNAQDPPAGGTHTPAMSGVSEASAAARV